LDKLDRLGKEEVKQLLGSGRTDISGDRTPGAGLNEEQIKLLIWFLNLRANTDKDRGKKSDEINPKIKLSREGGEVYEIDMLSAMENAYGSKSALFREGIAELREIAKIISQAGYADGKIVIDPFVVRGLEYYTGPVFECELLMDAKDDKGNLVRFGSIGGGGRYDGLVSRFISQAVPATGFSIGVSRLYSALKLLGKTKDKETLAPVVVLVMDKERQGDYQKMVQQLRAANIRAEMYVGTSGMKAQMKYADKRGSPLVVIQGGDEKARGEVTLKDLALGAQLASGVESREEYASQRLAQVSVPEADLVKAVKEMLGRGR
jgi:histidyl-tRNA synthetase